MPEHSGTAAARRRSGVAGGFALVDLQDALSQVFDGRPVDLSFPAVLDNPFRRRAILPELRPLFQ